MRRVVVGIITKKNEDDLDTYLLVSSTKDFGEFTGYFYPPGGHVEEGEEAKAALIREIKEELGLAVMPIKRVATTDGDIAGQITYFWTCEADDGEFSGFDGIAEAGYYTQSQILQMKVFPKSLEVLKKYIF